MPVSKRDWLSHLREEEESRGSYPKAEVGTFLAYSITGRGGPYRPGLAHEVDEGFVTSVTNFDGLESLVGHVSTVWIVADHNLTRSPGEVLAELGDITTNTKDEITKAIRPYFRKNRDAG